MKTAPFLSAGGLLAITKGYCSANSLNVENSTHFGTAASLGIAHYIAQNGSDEPVTISLSTGALFTAIMWGYYGNPHYIRWFTIGTALGYVAETIGGKYDEEANEKEDSGNIGNFNIEHHLQSLV